MIFNAVKIYDKIYYFSICNYRVMDESSKNFTVFDRDIFKSLTAQTKIISGNKPRNAFF